jgi:hypothetical protein
MFEEAEDSGDDDEAEEDALSKGYVASIIGHIVHIDLLIL